MRTAPTVITRLNYLKLVLRSVLFVVTLTVYLIDRNVILDNIYFIKLDAGAALLLVIWIFFFVEMIFRFFPSRYESMGSQKQFARNFVPVGSSIQVTRDNREKQLKAVIYVAVSWLLVIAVIAALYFTGIIDEGVLLIISLFFAVCDIICILFYCPFQSLIMKNRCCVTCRIYNWDFLMMFLPLAFIISPFTLSLAALALLLFIKWEAAYCKHPERFYEETNRALSCSACKEKLCIHKKSITSSARKSGQTLD